MKYLKSNIIKIIFFHFFLVIPIICLGTPPKILGVNDSKNFSRKGLVGVYVCLDVSQRLGLISFEGEQSVTGGMERSFGLKRQYGDQLRGSARRKVDDLQSKGDLRSFWKKYCPNVTSGYLEQRK